MPGISDRVHVRSIVGRFLEHSRLYWFCNGGDQEMYLGSADLMERNLDRRVEVLVPVLDDDMRRHLRDVVLQHYLDDSQRAMLLHASGEYRPSARTDQSVSAQQQLLQLYTERAE